MTVSLTFLLGVLTFQYINPRELLASAVMTMISLVHDESWLMETPVFFPALVDLSSIVVVRRI